MKNFLVVSLTGESLFLPQRLHAEGNGVILYVPKENHCPKDVSFQTSYNWRVPSTHADYVIFDSPGMGGVGSQLRKQGKPVFGGGKFTDLLAMDIDFSSKVESFIKVKGYTGGNGQVILLEGWFDGDNFLTPFFLSFPKDRLMEGDRGPVTPGMGTTLTTLEGGKLVADTLLPLTSLLRSSKYIGVMGVTLIQKNDSVEFISLRPSFSYDSLQAMGECLKDSWGDTFTGVFAKTLKRIKVYPNRFSIAVRFSIPPYPMQEVYPSSGSLKVLDGAEKHLWPAASGVSGVLGCVTAWGESIREANRRIQRTISNMTLSQDVQYRRDISEGIESSYNWLKVNNWLSGIQSES